MFPKSSLPFAPVSGFVAFDGGGAMPPILSPSRAKSAVVLRPPVVEPTIVEPETAPVAALAIGAAAGLRQTVGWQSPQGLRARRVEGVLLVAIVGYFVAATLGGLHLF